MAYTFNLTDDDIYCAVDILLELPRSHKGLLGAISSQDLLRFRAALRILCLWHETNWDIIKEIRELLDLPVLYLLDTQEAEQTWKTLVGIMDKLDQESSLYLALPDKPEMKPWPVVA